MVVTKRSFSNCTLKLVLNQRYIPFEGDIWQWKRFLFFREFWTTYRNWNYKTLWDKTNEDDILQSRALLWNSHLWRQSYDLKIRHNTLNCPILSIYVFPPIICKTWKRLVQLFLNSMLLAYKIQQKFRMNVPGWQKLCEGTKGLRRKVWTWMNILRPSIRYFVPISDLSWFRCFLEDLGAKKVFWDNSSISWASCVLWYILHITLN